MLLNSIQQKEGDKITKDLDARITDAQHRIEELYHDTQGKCYVSFSGGKDSTVLLALIKSCQELGTVGDIPSVFCNTGIELGVTVDFVKWVNENYYPIEQIRPEKSFDWVLKNEGKPIKSKLKSENLSRWQRTHTERLLLLLLLGRLGNGNLYRKSRLGDKDLHMISLDFGITASSKCCDYLKKKPFRAYERERESRESNWNPHKRRRYPRIKSRTARQKRRQAV